MFLNRLVCLRPPTLRGEKFEDFATPSLAGRNVIKFPCLIPTTIFVLRLLEADFADFGGRSSGRKIPAYLKFFWQRLWLTADLHYLVERFRYHLPLLLDLDSLRRS